MSDDDASKNPEGIRGYPLTAQRCHKDSSVGGLYACDILTSKIYHDVTKLSTGHQKS